MYDDETWDTSESRLETSVVLEKMEISGADRVRNEEGLQRIKEGRNILHAIQRMTANCIGHILHRHCLLKHVIGGDPSK